MIEKTGCVDRLGVNEFRAITNRLTPTEIQKQFGKNPVTGEKIMHAVRCAVARRARIDDQYAATAARQDDRRVEPGRPGADDDHVIVESAVGAVLH